MESSIERGNIINEEREFSMGCFLDCCCYRKSGSHFSPGKISRRGRTYVYKGKINLRRGRTYVYKGNILYSFRGTYHGENSPVERELCPVYNLCIVIERRFYIVLG